jgi:hypothetical protein
MNDYYAELFQPVVGAKLIAVATDEGETHITLRFDNGYTVRFEAKQFSDPLGVEAEVEPPADPA